VLQQHPKKLSTQPSQRLALALGRKLPPVLLSPAQRCTVQAECQALFGNTTYHSPELDYTRTANTFCDGTQVYDMYLTSLAKEDLTEEQREHLEPVHIPLSEYLVDGEPVFEGFSDRWIRAGGWPGRRTG
jgi:hypothetical protein